MSRRCPGCCDDCDCDDTCIHCPGTNAPTKWNVQIAGLVDGICNNCEAANTNYFLDHDSTTGCVWSCTLPIGCDGHCDLDEITLILSKSGSDFLLTVQLGQHVWELNNGATEVACCEKDWITVPHKTNSGDCNSSNATCRVRCGTIACPTIIDCSCPDARYNRAPCCFAVTVTDIVGNCPAGCSVLNKTWNVKQIDSDRCTWECDMANSAPCNVDVARLTLVGNTMTFTLGDNVFQRVLSGGSAGPLLCNVSGNSLPPISSAADCSNADATCIVVPRRPTSNGIPFGIPGGVEGGPCPCFDIAGCACTPAPRTFTVDLLNGGWTTPSNSFCSSGECEAIRGEYDLEWQASRICRWIFDFGGCSTFPGIISLFMPQFRAPLLTVLLGQRFSLPPNIFAVAEYDGEFPISGDCTVDFPMVFTKSLDGTSLFLPNQPCVAGNMPEEVVVSVA